MSETKTLDEFQEKFRVDELKVLEIGAWSWSVRPTQPTLGSGDTLFKQICTSSLRCDP